MAVGAALAVKSAASVFDAPGRFSTTNGCLKCSANLSASRREMMSMPPPERRRHDLTGLAGYGWASAALARAWRKIGMRRIQSSAGSRLEDPSYRGQAGGENRPVIARLTPTFTSAIS